MVEFKEGLKYQLVISSHYGPVVMGEWYIQIPSDLPNMFQQVNRIIDQAIRCYLEIGDFTKPFGYQLRGVDGNTESNESAPKDKGAKYAGGS